MLQQKAPNRWSCLLISFAMILDEPWKVLAREIGHDGSEIIWPDLGEPYMRRGYHIQEIIDCCLRREKTVTIIEKEPISQGRDQRLFTNIYPNNEERFSNYLQCYNGVIAGTTMIGKPHAVAWYEGIIYDPVGKEYHINQLNPELLCIVE